MSQVGDGTADFTEAAAAQATAGLGLGGSTVNPPSMDQYQVKIQVHVMKVRVKTWKQE
jgi:hypothetical protein